MTRDEFEKHFELYNNDLLFNKIGENEMTEKVFVDFQKPDLSNMEIDEKVYLYNLDTNKCDTFIISQILNIYEKKKIEIVDNIKDPKIFYIISLNGDLFVSESDMVNYFPYVFPKPCQIKVNEDALKIVTTQKYLNIYLNNSYESFDSYEEAVNNKNGTEIASAIPITFKE